MELRKSAMEDLELIQAFKGLNPALWRHRNIKVARATRFFGDLPAQMQ